MLGEIIVVGVGVVFIILGYLVWKREKINILHSYHYRNVSPDNKKVFCKMTGQGLMLIGCGLLITGLVISKTHSMYSFIAFAVGLIAGITLLINAGSKYNNW